MNRVHNFRDYLEDLSMATKLCWSMALTFKFNHQFLPFSDLLLERQYCGDVERLGFLTLKCTTITLSIVSIDYNMPFYTLACRLKFSPSCRFNEP